MTKEEKITYIIKIIDKHKLEPLYEFKKDLPLVGDEELQVLLEQAEMLEEAKGHE